jgi:transcriptional/translational regulatory protein YebC/TACO1
MFEPRGVVGSEVNPDEGDDIALVAIDAGAEDFKLEGSYLELYVSPENLESLRSTLEQQGVKVNSAELSMVPSNTVLLDAKVADQTLRLLDNLDGLDDIQKVYTNADFPDEALEQYSA